MDINNLTIIGRLTREPELKSTNNGKYLCRFSIANQKSKDQANFFDCVAWEKTAEMVAQYCKKGTRVAITGSISQETWDDKDGQKRSKVVIVASRVQFLTPKESGSEQEHTYEPRQPSFKDEEPFSDDIPF